MVELISAYGSSKLKIKMLKTFNFVICSFWKTDLIDQFKLNGYGLIQYK